jgi:oxaloacetate decarboxylase alpha subunit
MNNSSRDLKLIRQFVQTLKDTDIVELVWERNGIKLGVKKEAQDFVIQPATAANPSAKEPLEPSLEQGVNTKIAPENSGLTSVKSTMVGTFWRSTEKDGNPLAREGDLIKEGQPIAVVEAMKIFKEVRATGNGKIVQFLVENGQSVEYGQELVLIRNV